MPPSRQDRIATLGPLASVLLFLAAIVAAFWYLRYEESEREAESVMRDAEISQQLVRQRLGDMQDAMQRLARDLTLRARTAEQFNDWASDLSGDRSELSHVSWLGKNREVLAIHSDRPFHPEANPDGKAAKPVLPGPRRSQDLDATYDKMQATRISTYSAVFTDNAGDNAVQLLLPIVARGDYMGSLIAEVSLSKLLRAVIPADMASRHAVRIVDRQQNDVAVMATDPALKAKRRVTHQASATLEPMGNGLSLVVAGRLTSLSLIGNTLFWMVLALSGLTVWALLGTWNHVRRRTHMQSVLVKEANFRRAMENSMLTGMRAMDRNGRITYVNPAFCAMTGFTEQELLGKEPPFPFWPDDAVEDNARVLAQELEGRSPMGGVEVRLARKDGSSFDARMYISPLVDAKGVQSGWMTSITNITEAKRVRDQLAASHERFTTVLEGLDAVVSVLSVQQGELLFANRTYRHWFGNKAEGHALLVGQSAGLPNLPDVNLEADGIDDMSGLSAQMLTDADTAPHEIFVTSLQKWFDVRARYLQWTDGRLAQMLVATDVTARRNGEELAMQQAQKAQTTSRLITMGEMASSVAHELNQPLTAITNYCNGMISRLQTRSISDDDLVKALEKTAKQAERAGLVIRRIRAFVKRSEPQRQPTLPAHIVEDAVELANLDLARRNVRLHVDMAKNLPTVSCDPILIEQVVLNLIKNAAEAIDLAKLPEPRRHVELKVSQRDSVDEGAVVEFSVCDLGPGIRDDVLARLYEAFLSTKVEGLGIGLSLCRSIVESHRGRIKGVNLYNGEVIVGCQFTFTLPLRDVHDPSDTLLVTPLNTASPLPPLGLFAPSESPAKLPH
jgi:PAS domain S-box-containing protein